jgi:hypothetical protein
MSADTNEAEDRQQREDIQRQLVHAWITHDRFILDRLLNPEWMVTHADGRLPSRAGILRDFDTGSNRLLEVPHYARGEYKGHPCNVTLRFTDVFLRRGAGWQAVVSHATRLAAPDTTAPKSDGKS